MLEGNSLNFHFLSLSLPEEVKTSLTARSSEQGRRPEPGGGGGGVSGLRLRPPHFLARLLSSFSLSLSYSARLTLFWHKSRDLVHVYLKNINYTLPLTISQQMVLNLILMLLNILTFWRCGGSLGRCGGSLEVHQTSGAEVLGSNTAYPAMTLMRCRIIV